MRLIYLLLAMGLAWGPAPCAAETSKEKENSLTPALNTQSVIQKEAKTSQKKIDGLDDEAQTLLHQYRALSMERDDLEAYNAQMTRLLADQHAELAELDRQIGEIEVTKRRIVPLLERMVEVLERFVSLDTPFLPKERAMRLEQLKAMLNRADVSLPEKYRRVMEAYRIEAEYGHSIEAYSGDLYQVGAVRTVEFLRLGRTAVYYLSLDGNTAGYWDRQTRQWQTLPDKFRDSVARGLLIAKKQVPPDLVSLPVPAPIFGP
jgi:hypothetical protein